MTDSYLFSPDYSLEEASTLADWCQGYVRFEQGRCVISVPTAEGSVEAAPGDRIMLDGYDFRVVKA